MGAIGSGFNNCYFTNYRNYVIVSSSLPMLIDALKDIGSDNTWKKSLRKSKFLAQTNPESSYSIYLNMPESWDYLAKRMHPQWKTSLLRYDYVIKSFENIFRKPILFLENASSKPS